MPLLRQWRKDAGLTQVELGEAFSRPHSFVAKCELGERRVDVAELARWAVACGLDPAEAMRQFAKMARISSRD